MADSHSTDPVRVCTKCGVAKPYSDYTKVSKTKIGLSSRCKACARDYHLATYPERAQAVRKAQLAKYHKRQEPIRIAKAAAKAERLAAPTKRCGRCGEIKDKAEFGVSRQRVDGLKPFCKPCHNAANKVSRDKNPESTKASGERWRKNNMAAAARKSARWYATEKGRAKRREWIDSRADWIAKYHRDRRKIPEIRIHHTIRARLQSMLRNKCGKRTVDILGYSASDLITHLERQFLPGMSWLNYGEWHIDHIVPLASFKVSGPFDPELKRAWALTNLRPLWAKDNIRKGAKRLFLI